ncbi:MAG TPA: hypothetical protein VE713_20180, partial [Pyrinomonadaceae bacterium]|nr:hypothetical protein [Pyrinomonadaceae bacterium]
GTYLAGTFLSVTNWLSDAWAHITPGQAALIIGLLSYCTHNGSKLCKRLPASRLFKKLVARLGKGLRGGTADGKKELLFFTALTVVLFLAGVCALALVFHVSP